MQKNVLDTPYGRLIPNFSGSDIRKKYRESVSYYEDGSLASIYLEAPQPVKTCVGCLEAESLTFYPNGNIKRLFPLYGQISSYWTEEDEYRLAKKVDLQLLNQTFHVAPLCIAFYPSGSVKCLTIWSKESLVVNTQYGQVESRFGFELSEDGKLKSIEPAFGVSLNTEYGTLYPYDSENYRLHAEKNSLSFDEYGKLVSAKTLKNRIKIKSDKGEYFIQASIKEDPLTGIEHPYPVTLTFAGDKIIVDDGVGYCKKLNKSDVSFV